MHTPNLKSLALAVSMISIWASSALSGFWQFHSFPGATEYHLVKFACSLFMCSWVRAMQPFFQLLHFRGPIGQMFLRVGGSTCMGSAADESPDIVLYTIVFYFWSFAPFLNQSAQKVNVVDNWGKIAHFWPPLKNRAGLVEVSIQIIHATPGF